MLANIIILDNLRENNVRHPKGDIENNKVETGYFYKILQYWVPMK